MSIINALVAPDSSFALMAVDTAAVDNSGAVFDVSKMIILPHINAAIGFRGTVLFGIHLHRLLSICALNFEFLGGKFDDIFLRAIDETVKEAGMVGLTLDKAPKAEVVLVGYSPMQDRVVMHHYRHEGQLVVHRDIQSVITPWEDIPACTMDGIEPDRNGLVELARRQVKTFDDIYPGAMGGELLIAEVGRSRYAEKSRTGRPTRINLHEHSDGDVGVILQPIVRKCQHDKAIQRRL